LWLFPRRIGEEFEPEADEGEGARGTVRG
jgi:hypothetical protein